MVLYVLEVAAGRQSEEAWELAKTSGTKEPQVFLYFNQLGPRTKLPSAIVSQLQPVGSMVVVVCVDMK